MAKEEHSPRVLDLTEHIISLNPAHYTVWLYRATIISTLSHSITTELDWAKEIALDNQKNYQIWHHRQVLVNALYPSLATREAILQLARSETAFMTEMFQEDAKNYHVWSYRQFLVKKLDLFPSQTLSEQGVHELNRVEDLISQDVRNNSAWSHRFFLVFTDPGLCTPGTQATEEDLKIPVQVINREIQFSQEAIRKASNNQSPWSYLRGVIRKSGRKLASVEEFAQEFVDLDGVEEMITSTCALDFMADVWTEKGESTKAEKALILLGEKYDRIRKGYWEWRRLNL